MEFETVRNFCVFFLLWLVFGLGGFGWMTLSGVSTYREQEKYSVDNTEEQCLLVEYEEVECEYSCSENVDNIQCDGITYQYLAIIESKCDNETVIGFDGECPANTMKALGTEYTCYLLDCDSEFAFSPFETVYWKAYLVIVCGLIGVLGIPCIFLYSWIKDWCFYLKYGYKP